MSWAAVAGAAIGVGGSLLAGDNASDAAAAGSDAQARAAQLAIEEQRRQYDLTRSDNSIMRGSRDAAQTRLNELLGLDAGPALSDDRRAQVEAELRRRLVSRYTAPAAGSPPVIDVDDGSGGSRSEQKRPPRRPPPWVTADGQVNEAALQAEIDRRMRRVENRAERREERNRPADYGSLLKPFEEMTPFREYEQFGADDLAKDTVYNSGLEFGLREGTDAVNARAIAGGGYDSGATLKALTRFANDYGSTKAEGAYNRYNQEYDTGYNRHVNEYDARYNRYNTNQSNRFNRLAGVSGAGQTAVNTVTNAGTNAAGNISGLYGDMGNARAAGVVGSANAWSGALGGINNAYQGYQNNRTLQTLINRDRNRGGGFSYGTGLSDDDWWEN